MAGFKVRKGDRVKIITGKEKGKQGKVLRTIPEKSQIVVEGINMIKRHARAKRTNVQGGIQTKEGPINVSNVQVVCGACSGPVRTGTKIMADGGKVRICRKCETEL